VYRGPGRGLGLLLPHELVARHVAPYVRALVARYLYAKGYGQERIARLLGVTQAMVNKYLSWSDEKILGALREAGVPEREASSVAAAAAEKLMRGDRTGYLEMLAAFMNTLLASGALCRLHRRLGAPSSCRVCIGLFQGAGDEVLDELRRTANVLKNVLPARLVPNVGSNIVYAKPGAESIEEVAGLTGGIIRLSDGRVAVVGDPVYGGSRHTAQVLLLARRRWPELRTAIVLAYKPSCVRLLEAKGLVVKVGPHCCPERLMDDFRRGLEGAPRRPLALVSLGGYNLEPVVYVLAEKPRQLVELVRECSAASSAAD